MKKKTRNPAAPVVPPAHNWRTSDEEEIARRRLRGQGEQFRITNHAPSRPVFSQFRVESESGRVYLVEIRDVAGRQFACECVDFRTNGLGTCKHVEAVLWHLEGRMKKRFQAEVERGPEAVTVVLDQSRGGLRVEGPAKRIPRWMRPWLAGDRLGAEHAPEEFLQKLRELKNGAARISQEIEPWLGAAPARSRKPADAA